MNLEGAQLTIAKARIAEQQKVIAVARLMERVRVLLEAGDWTLDGLKESDLKVVPVALAGLAQADHALVPVRPPVSGLPMVNRLFSALVGRMRTTYGRNKADAAVWSLAEFLSAADGSYVPTQMVFDPVVLCECVQHFRDGLMHLVRSNS